MERLTARKGEKRNESWFECPAVVEEENNKIYARLAELEDELEDETLVEVKPIDFPTWEEVKGLKKRVLARYEFWDITRVGESIYCIQTNAGICMECINNSIGYLQACAWVEGRRRKLIKELCEE